MEEDFNTLLELSQLLLERLGITEFSPIEDEDDITEEEWAARWAGVEGYCSTFNQFVYISMPQDVQELLQQMAQIVHDYDSEIEFILDDQEEEG